MSFFLSCAWLSLSLVQHGVLLAPLLGCADFFLFIFAEAKFVAQPQTRHFLVNLKAGFHLSSFADNKYHWTGSQSLCINYIKLSWKQFMYSWVWLKVSEYTFQENKNALKIMQVLLYTYFYNISLNVLRPNFLNICNLPVSHFPNIRKIRVKVGLKTNYFSYFMSSCTGRIVVFNNFYSLVLSQPRDKQNCAHNFLLFK